jgi:hypothetical protein
MVRAAVLRRLRIAISLRLDTMKGREQAMRNTPDRIMAHPGNAIFATSWILIVHS